VQTPAACDRAVTVRVGEARVKGHLVDLLAMALLQICREGTKEFFWLARFHGFFASLSSWDDLFIGKGYHKWEAGG